MNPRASIETDNVAWENSPYGCKCRHRKRGGTVSTAPQQRIIGEYPLTPSGEGADGDHEVSPSSSKAKGTAPVFTTVKSASKPKGVTKKAPTQPRRKKIPAPLNLAEAVLAPAQASRDVEESGARVQGYVSPPQERGQGVKRMLEECSDGEEDEPPTKKAKVGGAASEEGGRKKAPLKKNSKMKGLLQ